MKLYLAGPLFNSGELMFNEQLKNEYVRLGHTVLLPQDFDVQGKATKAIYQCDRDAIDACDMVIACCNGTQVDDGTAWEQGYAIAKGKRVIAYRSDLRKAGDGHGVNLMISESVDLYLELPFKMYPTDIAVIINNAIHGILEDKLEKDIAFAVTR